MEKGFLNKAQWQLTNFISWFLALIALVIYVCVAVGSVNQHNPLQDFHVFYTSAQYASLGKPPYTRQIVPESFYKTKRRFRNANVNKNPKKIHKHEKYKIGVNLNPPFFTMLIQPLVKLPYKRACYFWSCLLLLLLYAAVRMIASTEPILKNSSHYVALIFFIVLTYAPTLINASCGQLGGFYTFFLVLAWWLGCKGRLQSMAIVLGFLASVKLFVAFFAFWFLAKKQYRLFWVFVASGLFFTFMPFLFGYHWSDYVGYMKTIQNSHWVDRVAFSNWNVSLLSPFARVTNYFFPGVNNKIAYVIKVGYYFLVAGVMYFYVQRLRELDMKKYFDMIFVLTTLAMFMVCPLSWTYYLVCLVLVVVLLLKRAIYLPNYHWLILAIAASVFFIGIFFPFLPTLKGLSSINIAKQLVRGNLPFVGYMLLCAVAYYLSSQKVVNNTNRVLPDLKQLKFSLYSAYCIMLIPGFYALNHMMASVLNIFLFS